MQIHTALKLHSHRLITRSQTTQEREVLVRLLRHKESHGVRFTRICLRGISLVAVSYQ